MTRLLLATTSQDKIAEIRIVLDDLGLTIETLDDHPGIAPPDETGTTFAENARAKALYYAARTTRPAVADDSGLVIDALDGAPGVQSARFGGADASYPDRCATICRRLDARAARGRDARFVTALALAEDGRITFEAEGTVEGRITREPRGESGFGYDPIFYYPDFGCTLAEVSRAQKSAVSHRGRAFRQLRAHLAAHLARPGR